MVREGKANCIDRRWVKRGLARDAADAVCSKQLLHLYKVRGATYGCKAREMCEVPRKVSDFFVGHFGIDHAGGEARADLLAGMSICRVTEDRAIGVVDECVAAVEHGKR